MKQELNVPQDRKSEPRLGWKISSAASNVAQAKAKVKAEPEHDGKIGSISQTRIEHGVDPVNGEAMLIAVFPREMGRDSHRLDMSFLLAFPNLEPMFAEALLCWGKSCTPRTRFECLGGLRRFFFDYLESDWSNMLHPSDIDEELMDGFRDRLLNKPGRRGKALHPRSVSRALGTLRTILSALTSGPWASAANRIAERVPVGPAGTKTKNEPTEVLGLEQLLAILGAAEREVLATEQRIASARVLLAEGRERLLDPGRVTNNTRTDFRDLAVCLAAVDEAYPGVIADLRAMGTEFPALAGAIQFTHGQKKISSYFYPFARDLVPFALLLGVATVFNRDTIMTLNWSDIDFNKDRAGTTSIEIVGAKGRAARDLVRLLDADAAVSSQLSLTRLLACLRDFTIRLRPYLMPEHEDRLFVFVQKNGVKRPKSFGTSQNGDGAWGDGLIHFIKANKLQPFTLGQLRPSILNLVQFMDGSLEAARKVGNHGSPATTWTYYTSGGVRARYRERIGQVILLRERWLQTGGVIDPRRLSPEQDKSAATPGFSCLDPFDSPRPNQQPGRLCKDYGGCPSCPLAAAYPSDPLRVAYYMALEAAIYRSQGSMSARTWIERWTPVLADLAALRALIPPDVLEASLEMSIRLPNVG